MGRTTPLWCNRSYRTATLICLWVDIGGLGCALRTAIATTSVAKKLKSSLDVGIAGIEFGRSLIRIESVGDLVVAGLILSGR